MGIFDEINSIAREINEATRSINGARRAVDQFGNAIGVDGGNQPRRRRHGYNGYDNTPEPWVNPRNGTCDGDPDGDGIERCFDENGRESPRRTNEFNDHYAPEPRYTPSPRGEYRPTPESAYPVTNDPALVALAHNLQDLQAATTDAGRADAAQRYVAAANAIGGANARLPAEGAFIPAQNGYKSFEIWGDDKFSSGRNSPEFLAKYVLKDNKPALHAVRDAFAETHGAAPTTPAPDAPKAGAVPVATNRAELQALLTDIYHASSATTPEDRMQVQAALKSFGFGVANGQSPETGVQGTLTIDGVVGPRTTDAFARYAADRGLPLNGTNKSEVIAVINNLQAEAQARGVPLAELSGGDTVAAHDGAPLHVAGRTAPKESGRDA